MEGPTPVSALIHAATMVTAGVYLIVRTHEIFEAAPNVQHLAAIIGGVTIIVAGVIALVQWDIKRVIAYSTMSQIGYMFLAAGIGSYGYAMFHLFTHAFFKALLFLAAGVIIHHLAGEQDMRKMGGLRNLMPYTHAVFLIGALSLAGIPPLSGFWSKDGIISAALADGGALGYTLFALGLVGALLTGAYTFRLYYLVFHGEPSELVLEHAGGHGSGHATEPRAQRGTASTHTARGRCRCSSRWECWRSCRRSRGLLVIPGVWEPFLDLDRRRCRAARRGHGGPGLRDERSRRHARRDRDLACEARLSGRSRARRRRRRATGAGAQALFRRALRRGASRARPSSPRIFSARGSRSRSSRAPSVRSETASARPAAARPGSRPASCAHTPS